MFDIKFKNLSTNTILKSASFTSLMIASTVSSNLAQAASNLAQAASNLAQAASNLAQASSASTKASHAIEMNTSAYHFQSPSPTASLSVEAWSLEYMTGTSDMHGIRIAYRPDIYHEYNWPVIGPVRIEWETSLNLFDLHGSAKNEATYGASISPVLIKSLPTWNEEYPLAFEFGIGVSYVHDKKFGGVDIGSYYQFEDRLGLLMQLGKDSKSQLGLRYIHYSNGGLNTKNPGLDFLSITYIKRF